MHINRDTRPTRKGWTSKATYPEEMGVPFAVGHLACRQLENRPRGVVVVIVVRRHHIQHDRAHRAEQLVVHLQHATQAAVVYLTHAT